MKTMKNAKSLEIRRRMIIWNDDEKWRTFSMHPYIEIWMEQQHDNRNPENTLTNYVRETYKVKITDAMKKMMMKKHVE